MKTKYHIIPLTIETSGQKVVIDTNTKAEYERVKGLFLTCERISGADNSTLELSIDDNEIFPRDFDIMLAMVNPMKTFTDSIVKIDEKAKYSQVTGTYTDGGNAADYPYNVKIYLVCEQKS